MVTSLERDFELICEIEPPTIPNFTGVGRQIAALGDVATKFLVPDSHIGRATISSIAVAHEVQNLGAKPIVCLNARDRNELGFKRDLITAAAYGIDELLFVYGDSPKVGSRAGGLTVRSMLKEALTTDIEADFNIGVTARQDKLPTWKRDAHFLFAQVGYDLDQLTDWRATFDFDGPVYAGVMVVPSVVMAQKLGAAIPELQVPDHWIDAISRDSSAGVTLACDLLQNIEGSGAFDGVHLVPVSKYQEVAAALS